MITTVDEVFEKKLDLKNFVPSFEMCGYLRTSEGSSRNVCAEKVGFFGCSEVKNFEVLEKDKYGWLAPLARLTSSMHKK